MSAARNSRTALLTAATAALAMGLTGCGNSGGDSGGASTTSGSSGSGDTKNVAAVIKGLDNPFFQAMEQGIKATATADGVTVAVQAAADVGDTTGQADKLAALAGQRFGCYVVNPISGTNLVQALAPIGAAGTPIVNIDSPIDPKAATAAKLDLATYIGTDNSAAGGKAGTFVTSKVPAGSKAAIIGGIAGDVTSAARIDGFKAAAGSKLTIVQQDAADWKRDVALTKATDIIAAHPDIKAFFAANDDMGLGIVKAVQNAGKTGQIVVVSVDGNKDALQSVLEGGLTATVAQYPYAIGSLGLQACEVAAAGKDLPATIESPTALVDKSAAKKALAAFPRPFEKFQNPLTSLLP